MPTNRTILKERDAKPLIEEITRKIPGARFPAGKGRVELESVGDAELVLVEGQPAAVRRNGVLFPSLVNTDSLKVMPKITVDMGAVPHIAGGADVMAPGVRKIEGEFEAGGLVVVIDEKYGKFLAVGSSMIDSKTMNGTKKGKIIKSLHYVGDEVWEALKLQSKTAF